MEFIWLVKDDISGFESSPGVISTDGNGSFVNIEKLPEVMRFTFEFNFSYIQNSVSDDRIDIDGTL